MIIFCSSQFIHEFIQVPYTLDLYYFFFLTTQLLFDVFSNSYIKICCKCPPIKGKVPYSSYKNILFTMFLLLYISGVAKDSFNPVVPSL